LAACPLKFLRSKHHARSHSFFVLFVSNFHSWA
jgi:hypothetical protein